MMVRMLIMALGRVSRKPLLVLVLLGLVVSGCSSKDKESRYVALEVGTLYNLGTTNIERKNYGLAAAYFDEVERQHPYSEWARRAQLMAAYSYYLVNDYDEAILSAERFLALHPGNDSAPYAYYLIAISHYEQITDVGRDQSITKQAMSGLQQVMSRYPDTAYAADAQLKYDLTRDHLAGKEMEVGRFYQSQEQYLSALMRFNNVIKYFQTTTHVAEALHRLVEVYTALGVTDEAREVAAVLQYNFPDSKWYAYSYSLLEKRGLSPDIDSQKKKNF